MRASGKLIAASMLIGAAAGIYASKQLNKSNTKSNNESSNIQPANQNFTVSSTHGKLMNNPSDMNTAADTPISYEYDADITADKSSTPTNIYFSNEVDNAQQAGQGTTNTDNNIKIDMI